MQQTLRVNARSQFVDLVSWSFIWQQISVVVYKMAVTEKNAKTKNIKIYISFVVLDFKTNLNIRH